MKKITFVALALFALAPLVLTTHTVYAVARDTFPSSHRLQPMPANTKPNISSNIESTQPEIAPGLTVQPDQPETSTDATPTDTARTSHSFMMWWWIIGSIAIIAIIVAVARSNKND